MARIVFMGTPQFAVPALIALDECCELVGVVTQPDRQAGRGRRIIVSPVKETALARGLPLFQPSDLRDPVALARLAEWRPDLIAVAAFGQILDTKVLTLPPFGCLNIHPSLLPAYRGATPIPAAILAGDAVTGVTIMCLDEGLDTGPILAQAECPIKPDDTTASLTARLAELGGRLLVDTVSGWIAGQIQPQTQDDAQATYCQPLTKEAGHLDWSRDAAYLARQVRACDPWPGTYTTWQGKRLKVLRAQARPHSPVAGSPGQVVALEQGIGVATGRGVLVLDVVQLAGKKPAEVGSFVRGQRGFVGEILGQEDTHARPRA